MKGKVQALYRYPIKSMQGEAVEQFALMPGGIQGDRTYALLDTETGRVCSAHHPAKWGALLHCRARWDNDERVVVTLPDGRELEAGPTLETALSEVLGRPVQLIREAPEGGSYEIVHPDIEGVAPDSFIERTLEAAGVRDGRIGRLRVALDAPRGVLVDVAPVHLIAMPSLQALAASGGDADVRRYRPNIVFEVEGTGYLEQALADTSIGIGDAVLHTTIPTPRCVMTTVAQRGGVLEDSASLRALARDNRLDLGGGSWACLGNYASVERVGAIRIGDALVEAPSAHG